MAAPEKKTESSTEPHICMGMATLKHRYRGEVTIAMGVKPSQVTGFLEQLRTDSHERLFSLRSGLSDVAAMEDTHLQKEMETMRIILYLIQQQKTLAAFKAMLP